MRVDPYVLKILRAIVDGYDVEVKDDRYFVVENPDHSNPWDDPYLVLDVDKLQEVSL